MQLSLNKAAELMFRQKTEEAPQPWARVPEKGKEGGVGLAGELGVFISFLSQGRWEKRQWWQCWRRPEHSSCKTEMTRYRSCAMHLGFG